jgi:hypothetical protein
VAQTTADLSYNKRHVNAETRKQKETNVRETGTARRIAAGLATALAFTLGLAACGGGSPDKLPDPTNTDQLIQRYEGSEDKDNYRAEGTVAMGISFLGMDMPLEGTLKMENDGTSNHCLMDLSGEILGESTTSVTEVYSAQEADDAIVTYSRTTEDGQDELWKRSTSTVSETIHDSLLSTEKLKGAKFEATDDGYTLTLNATDADAILNALNMNTDELMSSMGTDMTATPTDDTAIVYTFDKDCYPTKVSLKVGYDFAYTGDTQGLADLSDIGMGIDIAIDMSISGYGTIRDEDIQVPDVVRANAVEDVDTEDETVPDDATVALDATDVLEDVPVDGTETVQDAA